MRRPCVSISISVGVAAPDVSVIALKPTISPARARSARSAGRRTTRAATPRALGRTQDALARLERSGLPVAGGLAHRHQPVRGRRSAEQHRRVRARHHGLLLSADDLGRAAVAARAISLVDATIL